MSNLIIHNISLFIIIIQLSACYALLKRWDEALDEAKLCLLKDPKSVKGFYRKAQAYIELNQLSEADDTIMEGLQIDPSKLYQTNQISKF